MRIGYILAIAVALALALASRGSAASVATTAIALAATASNQIGLVVDFGNGIVITRCIQFAETHLTGDDVLNQSGLSLIVVPSSGMGTAVCAINGTGCSSRLCFCAMPNYWSYWHLSNGAWVYSTGGASNSVMLPGAVEGWRWGSSTPPQVTTFNQVCAVPPSPTAPILFPTVSPTNPPQPTVPPITPTSTAVPTATIVPRVIVGPAPSTPPPVSAPPQATRTAVPLSATTTPALAPQAVVAPSLVSTTPGPSVTATVSDRAATTVIARPTVDVESSAPTTQPVVAAATDPPDTRATPSVHSTQDASGNLSPTPTLAVRATPTATAPPVQVALLRQISVSKAVNVATVMPARPTFLPTTVPVLGATAAAQHASSDLSLGYVVFGLALLGLLIYLFGGRGDP